MKTISWFEIPTAELGRAAEFYGAMLGRKLTASTMPGFEMMIFPYEMGHTGGCLIKDPRRSPQAGGTLVYFACDALSGGLDGCIARARAAGGEVLLPRTDIGEPGFIALVRDSEGNVIGLHAER